MGIDFGTTRTVVASAEDGRHPVVSFEIEGGWRDWFPGAVTQRGDAISYGWRAAEEAPGADAVIRSLKRAVASRAPDERVDELALRPTAIDLLTGFVTALIAELEAPAGERIEAMIAVPANATSRQRWMTIEAFRRAGVRVLGVLNEPTAAGIELAYRHLGLENKRSPKRYVVVYDLGGGTFDASAISLAGRRFELLATEGLSRLGGDDFDEVIAALAAKEAGLDLEALASPARAALFDAARAAKEAMTPQSKHVLVELAAAVQGASPVVLPAQRVLAACEPLVERTLELLDRLFARLPERGVDPGNARELGAVYVVGGGAAFVGVARALRARYGKKLQLAPIPHAATAIGLAVAADPAAGIYVQDAVTRHFGVWREGDAGRVKIFDPIFTKETRSDAGGELVVRRRYRPRHTVGHLRFLECSEIDSDGGPAGDLTLWSEIYFPYDASERERDAHALAIRARETPGDEIEETYRYGAGGAITMRVENLTRGYARTYDLGALA
ncbi:MAG: Hsp70 family protein [Myxococcota bacterium]|nr:Hsp70 family protein [Myxococcota bacterium]